MNLARVTQRIKALPVEHVAAGFVVALIVSLFLNGRTLTLEHTRANMLLTYPHLVLLAGVAVTSAVVFLRQRVRLSPLLLPLALLFLIATYSIEAAVEPDRAILFLMGLARSVAIVGLFMLIPVRKQYLKWMIRAFCIVALFAGAFAMLQEIFHLTLGYDPITGYVLPDHVRFFGYKIKRAHAFGNDPNYFAIFISIGLLFIHRGAAGMLKGRARIAALGFLFVVLFFTFSRGVWIALIGALLFHLLRPGASRKQRLGMLMVVLFSIISLMVVQVARKDPSISYRMEILQTNTHIATTYPWTGVGIGNHLVYEVRQRVQHNTFFEALNFFGIPGLLIWVFFWAVLAKRALTAKLAGEPMADFYLLLLLSGATLNLLTNMYVWTLIGMIDYTAGLTRKEQL